MPFTLSHAAAAWPFRKTRLVFTALVIGCFVPDLPYFLFLKAHGFSGHTLLGMFLFDLPVGLCVLWLFERYVKQASLIYLPQGFRRRLSPAPFPFLPPARLALIAASILVGSATHILWDSFTHSVYWPYQHWSFLSITIPFPVLQQIVMYKLLQYISSVIGTLFVAIWIGHWYRSTAPAGDPAAQPFTAGQKLVMWVILPLAAICGGMHRAHHVTRYLTGIKLAEYFFADTVITAIALFGIGLLAFGIVLRLRRSSPQRA